MKVLMNKTETVLDGKGPMRLNAGEVYELPDLVGESIIGRGYGSKVVEEQKAEGQPVDIDYKSKSVEELRAMAIEKNIEGADTMKKAQLIKELTGYTDVSNATFPKEEFEKVDLTGGVEPPVAEEKG